MSGQRERKDARGKDRLRIEEGVEAFSGKEPERSRQTCKGREGVGVQDMSMGFGCQRLNQEESIQVN